MLALRSAAALTPSLLYGHSSPCGISSSEYTKHMKTSRCSVKSGSGFDPLPGPFARGAVTALGRRSGCERTPGFGVRFHAALATAMRLTPSHHTHNLSRSWKRLVWVMLVNIRRTATRD